VGSATVCGAAVNFPARTIVTIPTASAPISGGTSRWSRCDALIATNAAAIGAAIQNSSRMANTRSRPNRRNTPATMPITIGSAPLPSRGAPNRKGEREHKDSGGDVRADHLGVAQMTERGARPEPRRGWSRKRRAAGGRTSRKRC